MPKEILNTIPQQGGMSKLKALLGTDILALRKQKSKKLPFKKQQKVIQLFNNLFNSGFNLTEIVSFFETKSVVGGSLCGQYARVVVKWGKFGRYDG